MLEHQAGPAAVPQLTALGRSLSSIEIAPLWAEMVDVVWPRDPLQRVESEDGLRLRLEWKMLWSDDKHFTRVNSIACNPQDRVMMRPRCYRFSEYYIDLTIDSSK